MKIVDVSDTPDQLGTYTVSNIWFAWGQYSRTTQIVSKFTPYMTCRDSLLLTLYNKLVGKQNEYSVDYQDLVLIAMSKDKTGLLSNSYNVLLQNYKDFSLVGAFNEIVVFRLQENYYKFPFLTSYFCLLVRAAGFFKNMPIKEMHKHAQMLAFLEANYLSALDYDEVQYIISNLHKVDFNKHVNIILKLCNDYGTGSVATHLGINGLFKTNSNSSTEYRNFLFSCIK